MPLPNESLVKFYRGTRLLGALRPFIIAAGESRPDFPFGEYYIFHELPNVSFLCARSRCAPSDELYPTDFSQFPKLFSASAMLDRQFRAAEDRLQNEATKSDPSQHRETFYSSAPLAYEETDYLPLLEFQAFGQFSKELAAMFKFSRCRAIRELKDKITVVPQVIVHEEKP